MSTTDRTQLPVRRLVLIDFDWRDADVLPQLLRTPDTSVRLVSGSHPDEAGLRIATLCGLPRSVELEDLTRDIFDVALVGDRSPRREQISCLLRSLGTTVQSAGDVIARREAPEPAQTSPPVVYADEIVSADVGELNPPAPAEDRCRLAALEPGTFTLRLRMAIERHVQEGFRFGLLRLAFDGPEAAVGELVRELPGRLRASDCVCQVAPREVLLLCAGRRQAVPPVRLRIEFLWQQAWERCGGAGSAPTPTGERFEVDDSGETHELLVAADGWIAGR